MWGSLPPLLISSMGQPCFLQLYFLFSKPSRSLTVFPCPLSILSKLSILISFLWSANVCMPYINLASDSSSVIVPCINSLNPSAFILMRLTMLVARLGGTEMKSQLLERLNQENNKNLRWNVQGTRQGGVFIMVSDVQTQWMILGAMNNHSGF